MAQTSYTIGEVAEVTGFPLTTLRFYESRGLMPQPERSASGHRLYRDHHVERLGLIARAKGLGLTLDEAAALADAWQGERCSSTHPQLVAFLDAKLVELREQIAELTRFASQVEAVYADVTGGSVSEGGCGPQCGCAAALAPDHTSSPGGQPPAR